MKNPILFISSVIMSLFFMFRLKFDNSFTLNEYTKIFKIKSIVLCATSLLCHGLSCEPFRTIDRTFVLVFVIYSFYMLYFIYSSTSDVSYTSYLIREKLYYITFVGVMSVILTGSAVCIRIVKNCETLIGTILHFSGHIMFVYASSLFLDLLEIENFVKNI